MTRVMVVTPDHDCTQAPRRTFMSLISLISFLCPVLKHAKLDESFVTYKTGEVNICYQTQICDYIYIGGQ